MSTYLKGGGVQKGGRGGKRGGGKIGRTEKESPTERPEGRLGKNSFGYKLSLGALFPARSDRGTTRKKATRRCRQKKQPLQSYLKINSAAVVNYWECWEK